MPYRDEQESLFEIRDGNKKSDIVFPQNRMGTVKHKQLSHSLGGEQEN